MNTLSSKVKPKPNLIMEKDLTGAIHLAKKITWYIKQRKRLGPFPQKNGGWFVAEGICYKCRRYLLCKKYGDYEEALRAAEENIKKFDIEDLYGNRGPILGLSDCEYCSEQMRLLDEIEEEHCRMCGADCGHCSIYAMFEDF